MIEKRNAVIEKKATGDSRDLDDIVEAGALKFARRDDKKGTGQRQKEKLA